MQSTEFASNLINDIGAKLGLDGLKFDPEGQCFLAVGEMPVAIRVQNDQWQVAGFVAEIAEGEENEELSFSAVQWRSLLEINHALATEGYHASLTYDRDAECVLFIQPLLESQLEGGQVVTLLETFVHRMEEIRRLLDEVQQEPAADSSGALAEADSVPLNLYA